jgi:hypothetical protein
VQDEDKIYGLVAQAEAIQQHAVDLQGEVQKALETLREGVNKAVGDNREAAKESARTLKKAGAWSGLIFAGLAAIWAVLLFVGTNWYINARWRKFDELRDRAAAWEQHAGKAKLNSCGPRGRLCVEVDTRAGTFGDRRATYMVIKGY